MSPSFNSAGIPQDGPFNILTDEQTEILKRMVKLARKEWGKTPRYPHFTDHGIGHSKRILKKLNMWLTKREETLSNVEAFILLGAAYLHDIGMQCYEQEFLDEVVRLQRPNPMLTESDYEKMGSGQYLEDILDGIRKYHSTLSRRMIEAKCGQLTSDFAEHEKAIMAVALVSEGHAGEYPNENLTIDYELNDGTRVNLRRLAYMLRIGDCLDATKDRVPLVQLENEKRVGTMLPHNELHIAKHWIVADVRVEDRFYFKFEIPQSWRHVEKDLVTIALDPLLRNIERHNLPNMHETHLLPEGPPVVDKPISVTSDEPWPLRPRVVNSIAREAIKYRVVDALMCGKDAEKELWIAGQNCYTLAFPNKIWPDEFPDESYFKKGFFDLMNGDKKLAVRILILDPLKHDEVEFWGKLLKKKNPKMKESFKDHLQQVILVFQQWQAEARVAGLSLEIKCGDLVVDTANIVDPEDSGRIYYSRNLQDALADPLERSWFVSRYGDLDYEDRLKSYKTLFKKARPIEEVGL